MIGNDVFYSWNNNQGGLYYDLLGISECKGWLTCLDWS